MPWPGRQESGSVDQFYSSGGATLKGDPMLDVVEESPVLEPGTGADESSDKGGYVDRSIDTSIPLDEAEAEAEVVGEEPEIEAESPTADDGNVEEKKPGSAEERIDELTRKWRTTERENEAMQAELEKLRKQSQPESEAPQPFRSRSEFASEDAYNTYLSNEVTARAEQVASKVVSRAGKESERDQIVESFGEREKVYAKDNPGYFDLVYDRGLKISEAMKDVIQADDNGLDLAVYLGKNPDIAKDIFLMPDVKAGMKLNQLLADIGDTKAKAKALRVTKAPPPVPKIAKSETSLDKDVADMSDAEFAKWRRKQIANR